MTKAEIRKRNNRVPELMGPVEVAEVLGVHPNNIDRVAHLPEPAQELSRGRVWRADVIREYAAERANNGNGKR